ncbi:hypothetical protein BCR37DRAFT_303074 [Protomyces lactucae-debilis]|uniref:Skg3/CAF120-like PH-like domain-containing protein n=1 Tax=Protomyces lactucae-debilis TaxID=2754530 RepID=A0A1Y2FEW4_PROLT|nr:uncharacterized protein BCR37DRAFT_303074 [Protomyces lactucae-debilis]ORY82469.1 hypothetical protein BCR37DRAFT_303074 [Protomyces lactucae-debilis]
MLKHRRHRSEQAKSASSSPSPSWSLPHDSANPSEIPSGYSEATRPFAEIVQELNTKKTKLYYEGFLQRREDLDADGAPTGSTEFFDYFAQLEGTSLLLWSASSTTIPLTNAKSTSFANLADARFVQSSERNSIIVSTIGRNRFTLRPCNGDLQECDAWYVAFRLAVFERARLQEIYTARLVKQFGSADVTKKDARFDSYVEARVSSAVSAQSQWTRLYCRTATPQKTSLFKKRHSRSISASSETGTGPPGTVELQLFADKRDRYPQFVVTNVFAAYALYPESASLIETAAMLKLEGQVSIVTPDGQLGTAVNGNVLLLPINDAHQRHRTIGTTPSLQSLLNMASAIWAAFSLYGKPDVLHLDVDHVEALGRKTAIVDLTVLQVMEIEQLDVRMSDMSWRAMLREKVVLWSHYKESQGYGVPVQLVAPLNQLDKPAVGEKRAGKSRRVLSEGSITFPPQPLVTTLEEDDLLERLGRSSLGIPLLPRTDSRSPARSQSSSNEADRPLRLPGQNGRRERFSPGKSTSTNVSPTLSSPTVTGFSPRLQSSSRLNSPSVGQTRWSKADDNIDGGKDAGSAIAQISSSPAMLEARFGLSQQLETRVEQRRSSYVLTGAGSVDPKLGSAYSEAPARYEAPEMGCSARYNPHGTSDTIDAPMSSPSELPGIDIDALGLVRQPTFMSDISRGVSLDATSSLWSAGTDGEASIYSDVPISRFGEPDGNCAASEKSLPVDAKLGEKSEPSLTAGWNGNRSEAMRLLSIRRPYAVPQSHAAAQ